MQTELNVKLWAIQTSIEIRRLFAIHLLLLCCICIFLLMPQWTLSVCVCACAYQCDVLHYLRDTEVIHLKHQTNDKQPWFWKMHVHDGPSIQHSHFLCITITQGHYAGQGSMRRRGEKIKWLVCHSRRNADPMLSRTMCRERTHQSSFNALNLTSAV